MKFTHLSLAAAFATLAFADNAYSFDTLESEQMAEPVEAAPVEVEPVEAAPVEVEPVEAKPVEAKPVEAEPVEAEPVEAEPVADCTPAFREFDRVYRKKCIFERAIQSGRKNPLYAYEWHDTLKSCDKFNEILDKYSQECVVKYAEMWDAIIPPPAEKHELLKDKECGEVNYYYKDVGNCLIDYVDYLNARDEYHRFDVPEAGGCPHIINQYKKYPDRCARLLVDYHKKQQRDAN